MTSAGVQEHAQEIAAGQRFEFGKNWQRFLASLSEERIAEAVLSLSKMLGVENLTGRTFLDIGSGSGLFSLAARRLGARVFSFDFDPASVACGQQLRERYFRGDPDWTIEHGSALDEAYVRQLGTFDIVYSWGVLHHTGQMWLGLANAALAVKPGGQLFVAIYNDQGVVSQRWTWVKSTYVKLPVLLRPPVLVLFFIGLFWKSTVKDFLRFRPFATLMEYRRKRGMTVWRDLEDWVGGYPFEVAKPEGIFDFYQQRGFRLERMTTVNDLGCNEFVFRRE